MNRNKSTVHKIATNDVFQDLCLLLRIHKDKDYLIELFGKAGWEVSRKKIKSWTVRAGPYNPDFRSMPEQALRDFILVLKSEKIISDVDDGE